MKDWYSTLAIGGRGGKRAEFKWKSKSLRRQCLRIQIWQNNGWNIRKVLFIKIYFVLYCTYLWQNESIDVMTEWTLAVSICHKKETFHFLTLKSFFLAWVTEVLTLLLDPGLSPNSGPNFGLRFLFNAEFLSTSVGRLCREAHLISPEQRSSITPNVNSMSNLVFE